MSSCELSKIPTWRKDIKANCPNLHSLIESAPPLSGRCADVFVACLLAEKIEYVFGIPGEENLDFLDALRKESRVKLIITRHEQAAGFMASIVGRLTGRPGVCLATLGPGATNFSTSVSYSWLGGFPSIVITGQKPIRTSKQGRFQILDVVESFKPITKFAHQISEASQVPFLVREAVRISIEEKPGPVHLELPEDIAEHHVLKGTHGFPDTDARRPVPDEKACAKAVDILRHAKKPMIICGAGTNRKGLSKRVNALVEKFGFYCVSTQMGKGVMDEGHPNFLGCAALSAGDIMHVSIEHSDVIVMIGHDVIEKPPFFMHPNRTPVVIHINFVSAKVDPVYFPQCEVVGDIGNALWQIETMLEQEKEKFDWDFSFHKFAAGFFQEKVIFSYHTKSNAFPMNIQRVVADTRKVLQPSAILCLDNGMYKLHVARLYAALAPNTVLLDNALATMGAGLPAAIAAKILNPHREVVGFSGDGGFMMNSQELETAVREDLHLVQIIVCDEGYGMIKWKQGTSGFPSFGLDYANPDFVKYAEAYGAKGHLVKSTEEFVPLLRKCLSEKAVHVIAVPISYNSSDLELNVERLELVKDLESIRKNWVPPKNADSDKFVKVENSSGPATGPPIFPSDAGPIASGKLIELSPNASGKLVDAKWPIYVGSHSVMRANNLLPVTDKYTNEVFANVSQGTAEDVNNAIVAAEKALESMQNLAAYERKKILQQCVEQFRTRFNEFAYILAREAGKPITDAEGEVNRLIDTFEIASEEAVRLYGEYAPLDISERNKNVQSIVRRFPIGIVSMISPFNFPLNLTAHKIAPAIASGCPFVLKPASRTPLGALMLAEVLSKTGLPVGAFSVITCDRKVGDTFVTDERLKLLSFTGSPEVGWPMKARCGKKKCVLELGGNAACILDSWGESKQSLDEIVDRIVFGAFYQSGQSCIHLQRLFVHEKHYTSVIAKLVEKTNKLKKGNPLQRDTFVGPLISNGDAERIEKWVKEAVESGGCVIAGGKRYNHVYDATIVENVRRDVKLYVEEAFAPVLTVEPFSDFKSAVKIVNDSKFGIHLGIFTESLDKSIYAWERCEVGGVVVGDVPSYRCDAQPYGGVKDSGIGREGIRYAIEDMTEMRVLLLKNAGKI